MIHVLNRIWYTSRSQHNCHDGKDGGHEDLDSREYDPTSSRRLFHNVNGKLHALITVIGNAANVPFISGGLQFYFVVSTRQCFVFCRFRAILESSSVHLVHIVCRRFVLEHCKMINLNDVSLVLCNFNHKAHTRNEKKMVPRVSPT